MSLIAFQIFASLYPHNKPKHTTHVAFILHLTTTTYNISKTQLCNGKTVKQISNIEKG